MGTKEKVIQIATVVEGELVYNGLYLLTDKGRIFATYQISGELLPWEEVELPEELK